MSFLSCLVGMTYLHKKISFTLYQHCNMCHMKECTSDLVRIVNTVTGYMSPRYVALSLLYRYHWTLVWQERCLTFCFKYEAYILFQKPVLYVKATLQMYRLLNWRIKKWLKLHTVNSVTDRLSHRYETLSPPLHPIHILQSNKFICPFFRWGSHTLYNKKPRGFDAVLDMMAITTYNWKT